MMCTKAQGWEECGVFSWLVLAGVEGAGSVWAASLGTALESKKGIDIVLADIKCI